MYPCVHTITNKRKMCYIITISTAALIIAAANFLWDGVYSPAAFGMLLLTTAFGVVAVIAVDGLLAFIIRRLPEGWFAPEAKAFDVGKRERNFYRKSGINTWKKHVPEWGCFTGFHKDKMREPNDSAYIGRFLLESNYGVAGHIAGAFFGFLIMLIPILRPFSMALPIAAVNFVLSLLPTMVLRYNTPALRGLYRRNVERDKKKTDAKPR